MILTMYGMVLVIYVKICFLIISLERQTCRTGDVGSFSRENVLFENISGMEIRFGLK